MKYRGITIHKNKNCATWYTRIRVNGTQSYISAKTQKECYNKLKKLINNPTTTQKETPKELSLVEWYNQWLKLYKINKVKDTTLLDYKIIFKNVPKETQNTNIKDIKVSDIINILDNIQAERQKQKLYELLKIIFQKAVDNEIISKNIITRIDRPKHTKKNSGALTYEQESEFVMQCKNNKYGDLFLTTLYQGFRKGEILGLTIDNIDFTNNTITINKAWNKNNEFDTTKNKQSIRTIPMFDKTKNILLNYKEQKERIFNITNKQLQISTKELKNKLTFDFKLKDLRTTFITRCKENNIPEFVIQAWVGHRIGSKITSTVYTKHNADIDTKYIDIINKSKFYSNSTHNKK